MRRLLIPGITMLLAACSGNSEDTGPATPAFAVDMSRITVSGASAGAYMAGQMHVAHSALISGAGLIAGGPYWCAEGSIKKGLGPCMNGGDAGLAGLLAYAHAQSESGTIDNLQNLADDRVWLFHGTLDSIINGEVVAGAADFYAEFVPPGSITVVTDVSAPHGVPTLATGVACDTVASPFLNACDYDAAGVMLGTLSGDLQARTVASGELRRIAQPGGADAGMLDNALLYVPAACSAGETCGVHIAFHGCQQSTEFIDDAFAAGAGYNEWAESNNLLVLYPQVGSSSVAPINPLGCWDWWGYTGLEYLTRDAPQIAAVYAMLKRLAQAPG